MSKRIFVLCATLVLAGAAVACDSPDREPQARPSLAPYAYTTPIPEETPTEVDGIYGRPTTVEQAGGPPIKCARCAPYRLEAGEATLSLDEGRFFLVHDIGTEAAQGFQSVGHYVVSGDEIVLFNDPNCIRTRGTYRWRLSGSRLLLTTVDDSCFQGLRGEYLTAAPWEVP